MFFYIATVLYVGAKPKERPVLTGEIIGKNFRVKLPLIGTIWDLLLNPSQIWLGIRLEIK
jgi:hypothetical protein